MHSYRPENPRTTSENPENPIFYSQSTGCQQVTSNFVTPSGGAEEFSPGFSPGFQPWETSNKAVRPERARDGVGERPFECYRKGIGHFLGIRYNLPLANNAHGHKVERWRGPIEICFSCLLLITMIWRPFRARRPGGRFPGLKQG